MPRTPAYPQGIDEYHTHAKGWHKHANPGAALSIGFFLGLALLGLFGGQPHPTRITTTPTATVTTQFPEILRNGEFFEMRGTIRVKRPFKNLQLGISATYWRNMTINSVVPAPFKETSENGNYLFSFGPMETGDTLTIKIDGQINPPMFAGTKGKFTILDGNSVKAAIPLNLWVLP